MSEMISIDDANRVIDDRSVTHKAGIQLCGEIRTLIGMLKVERPVYIPAQQALLDRVLVSLEAAVKRFEEAHA